MPHKAAKRGFTPTLPGNEHPPQPHTENREHIILNI